MPFTITCPSCQAKLKATDTLVGKTIKCPRCSKPVLVQQSAPSSILPQMELPPAPPPAEEERPELEEENYDAPTRAQRRAGEAERLAEVEDVEEAEEIEEAELEDALPADDDYDDDYDRPRRRPRGVTPEDRQMAMFIYLLAIFTNFIGPLILWMIKREESKFINHHGKEVINFIITMTIPTLAIFMFGCPFIFITNGLAGFIVVPLLMILFIYSLVMTIIGTVRASNGEWFEFPIAIRMIR